MVGNAVAIGDKEVKMKTDCKFGVSILPTSGVFALCYSSHALSSSWFCPVGLLCAVSWIFSFHTTCPCTFHLLLFDYFLCHFLDNFLNIFLAIAQSSMSNLVTWSLSLDFLSAVAILSLQILHFFFYKIWIFCLHVFLFWSICLTLSFILSNIYIFHIEVSFRMFLFVFFF